MYFQGRSALGGRNRSSGSLTNAIVSIAEAHSGGRIVSLLEGGYNIPILAGCVEVHLKALGARTLDRR